MMHTVVTQMLSLQLQVLDVLVALHAEELPFQSNPTILLTSGLVDFQRHACVATPTLSELVVMVKEIHGSVEGHRGQSSKDLLKEVSHAYRGVSPLASSRGGSFSCVSVGTFLFFSGHIWILHDVWCLLQIEKRLYTSGDITVSAIQLRISENLNPFSEASAPVVYPLQLSGALSFSRLSDRLLPSMQIDAQVSDVDARVGIQELRVLRKLLSASSTSSTSSVVSPDVNARSSDSEKPISWPNITPRSFGEVSQLSSLSSFRGQESWI